MKEIRRQEEKKKDPERRGERETTNKWEGVLVAVIIQLFFEGWHDRRRARA